MYLSFIYNINSVVVYTNINLKNAYVQQFDKRYLKHPIKNFRNVFFHPKRDSLLSRQIKSNQNKKKNSCSTFLKKTLYNNGNGIVKQQINLNWFKILSPKIKYEFYDKLRYLY